MLYILTMKKQTQITGKKVKGGVALKVTCGCGLPLNRVTEKYGMDCNNKCAEKWYKKNKHMVETFINFMNKLDNEIEIL